MSKTKISEAVKALINAPHARPGYTRASAQVQPALEKFAQDATDKSVGLPAWVTISTAVSATLNCPEAMTSIFHLASSQSSSSSSDQSSSLSSPETQVASLIQEVGLKCISFNGIPRTINTLGAFHASLPATVASDLASSPQFSQPTRSLTPETLARRQADGRRLWDGVYRNFETKLLKKLGESHPDLPVVILDGHYSTLLSNPPSSSTTGAAAAAAAARNPVGRVLTSLVAVACLRAQTGVGPQVTSHVFGLRKAYESGEDKSQGEREVKGGRWLSGDEGNVWLLENVDRLVGAIAGEGVGTTFAPGLGAKL